MTEYYSWHHLQLLKTKLATIEFVAIKKVQIPSTNIIMLT